MGSTYKKGRRGRPSRLERPKARGLTQHGGPPGWLVESDPADVILFASLFRTVSVALPEAAQLRADGISSCCYIVNVHNHPSCATLWPGTLVSRPTSSLWLSSPHAYVQDQRKSNGRLERRTVSTELILVMTYGLVQMPSTK